MLLLTNGWSFLQALRSWDSLLRAMPDIAAHQRLPVEKTTQNTLITKFKLSNDL